MWLNSKMLTLDNKLYAQYAKYMAFVVAIVTLLQYYSGTDK